MSEVINFIKDFIILIKWSDILDISIVAFVVYKIIGWIRYTQAEQVAKGIIFILIFTQLSGWLGLHAVNFLLVNIITVGFIALIIVFQPELRRVLEQIGRTSFLKTSWMDDIKETKKVLDELMEAIMELSNSKTGGLIVMEKDTGLEDIMMTGTLLDSYVTSELLLNIFTPNTPLHDGAVIIRMSENKLKAASCLLPLTQNKNVSKTLGTRHRAGLGMSENSDAIVIIVSEESGIISYAYKGKLFRYLDKNTMYKFLMDAFIPQEEKPMKFKFWGSQTNDQRTKED